MGEISIGIRDLKAHLSEYLRYVQQGQVVIITDHGRPVGRLLPAEQTLEERLQSLQEAGMVAWNGRNLPRAAHGVHHLQRRAGCPARLAHGLG